MEENKNIEVLKNEIIEELDNLKARDIISIDIRKISSLAEHIIIATGRSSKHLGSIASNVKTFLRAKGLHGFKPEGVSAGGWVVLDIGDIIIHLFTKEVREVYNLEKLWKFKRD